MMHRIADMFLAKRSAARLSEVADGVFESRRSFLFTPIYAAVGLAFSGLASGQTVSSPGRLAWGGFLKDCLPTALDLHRDPSASGQDAYLFWLASMSRRLDVAAMPKGKLANFADLDPPVETGPSYFGKPFFIIEWRMAPNAYLPPHDHPNISVCTVCTDGEARIRNFQPISAKPASNETFKIRETHNELLTAGRVNVLSALRDNIHTFRAGKDGARGFDITTYHGKDEGFSFFDVAAKPVDADERMYEATVRKR